MPNAGPAEARRQRGFAVEVKGNQVWLTVDPGPRAGSVSVTDIYSAMLDQRIPWSNASLVETVIERADGQPHVVISDLAAVGKDAEFVLKISADRMSAGAQVRPAAWGKRLTLESLQTELQKAGIRYGVIPGVLHDIVDDQDEEREWQVAVGLAPAQGQDASISCRFDLQRTECQPSFLPDGRVDFRELDKIVNVEAGQVLAERVPPTPGEPGWTVFHEELPPRPGREVVWPVGKGVAIVDNKLVAETSGQLMYRQNKLTVSPVYQVAGDVDYSTGNIRFVGNVQVRGSVKPGFVVEAEGDILIAGWVDSASIYANGSIVVGGGIQGQGRGEVKAGADVTSRFIENCHVIAGGSIKVGEDIMHSTVFAGKSVEVGGRRGLIAGGTTRATDFVLCKVLGASLGTPTCIEVGTDPSVFEQYGRLQGDIARMEDEQAKLSLGVGRLVKLKEVTGQLAADKAELLQKLQAALAQRQQEIAERRTLLAAQEAAMMAIRDAYVKVSELVHLGARVIIGKASYFPHDRLSGGVFRLENGEVTYGKD